MYLPEIVYGSNNNAIILKMYFGLNEKYTSIQNALYVWITVMTNYVTDSAIQLLSSSHETETTINDLVVVLLGYSKEDQTKLSSFRDSKSLSNELCKSLLCIRKDF